MMKQSKGITLIALVITIIILLILAGVAIASLGGENGLIYKVQQAKKSQIEAEMKEKLVLALSELQLEKNGEATLDDVTQEWADSILEDYKPTITNDTSISGKKIRMSKSGITGKYIIDENLSIIEIEEITGAELTYVVKSRDGENLQVLVTVTDNENGLQTIEYNDGHIQDANGLKSASRDCTIQLGVEYRVKIISKSGEEKIETILISDYYHIITKNLDEGVSIDNISIKAAYNKPYKATITAKEGYTIDKIIVTIETVTVDETTGVINIEKVTGDITITATILTIPEANIYVSTKGNDITGDGSQENPYASLSTAINNAVTGDKIYIFPGEYNLTSMPYDSYAEVGIYDQGKKIEIFGANEKTILIYDGETSKKSYGNAVTFTSASILRNLIYEFKPKTANENYAKAILARSVSDTKINNVFFKISGENTASYYYSTGGKFENCIFYHETGNLDSSYGSNGIFTKSATNTNAIGNYSGLIVSTSFGVKMDEEGNSIKITDLQQLINNSKEDEVFNANEAGVYFGEYAWQ